MNKKAILFLKKFAYTFLLNLIALTSSILTVLIIPKLIDIEEYGYWQLYIFYSAYVGFMHLGWNDGIYLRFGGEKYNSLNKKLFSSQFYLLIIMQILLAFLLIGITTIFLNEPNKFFIIIMTLICMVVVNVRQMLVATLQGTNKIEKAANILVVGKVIYLIILGVSLLLGIRDFKFFVIIDLIGKLFSLILAVFYCRDIVFNKISDFKLALIEMKNNILIGSKLMFANIASLLIVGTVRLGIEKSWDVTTFGKISLVLSLSNLMMLFINAIGVIMFPILKRIDSGMHSRIFSTMKSLLSVLLLGFLLLFYPLKLLISEWLPQYSGSLKYMAILFPIIIYEGKIALLINTYFNALRKEKRMLQINLSLFILSIFFTVITTTILNNLTLAVISIVVLIALRGIIAEVYLSKILSVFSYKDTFLEFIVVGIFIIISWYINSWYAFFLYLIIYFIYLIILRRDIHFTISELKALIFNKKKDN